MKLNPAERHLYTILAERAEMTLDEWIQSLPRQQLAQLEAEDPEDYQSLMMDFAQHMLAGGADSPNASTQNAANWHVCQSLPRQQLAQLEAEDPEDYQSLMMDFAQHMLAGGADSPNASTQNAANWHVCPACKQKKYASAYPGESEICRMCTRKQAEEQQEEVVEDPEPEPAPDDGRYKTCGQCGEKRYKSVFAPGQTVCKHCQKGEAEADAQADQAGEDAQECKRCHVKKPVKEFSLIAGVCLACLEVARANAHQAVARRNEGA